MRYRNRFIWPALALLLCVAHDTHKAVAYPSTSPSARAAARLKYRPPANWIRHYLGDDRYKIAGNVWKVVSTQMDTYFHRPTCPNMLRQSAGIVIGFPSPADAFESGYAPCTTCQPGAESVTYAGSTGGGLVSTTVGGMNLTLNRGMDQRVVLADGVSTAILPSGWTRVSTSSSQLGARANQFGFKIDVFAPQKNINLHSKNAPGVVFGFFNIPGAEQAIRSRSIERFSSYVNNSGTVNNRVSNFANKIKVRGYTTISGLTAVTFAPIDDSTPYTVAARGSKVYLLASGPSAGAAGKKVLSSFQPR